MRDDDVSGFEGRERRQRERLRTAVVAAVAECGFEETTIDFVCDLSGCSLKTFHHHYDDLTACLKDGCSGALESSRAATISGWLSGHGWRQRLGCACVALLDHVEANADAARTVLIESLGAGPPLTDHLRETVAGFERALTMAFQLHPEGFPSSRQTPRAITGGVRHLLRLRLLDGRETPSAAEELEDWICCYRTPEVRRIGAPRPPASSGAPPEIPLSQAAIPVAPLPRLFPGEGERERVLEALGRAMLQNGRQTLEDETLARFAGLELSELRERHGGVKSCLSGLLEGFLVEADEALKRAGARAGSWPEAVRLGAVALLRHLDASPRLSRLLTLRLPLVPSLAAERRDAVSELLMGFVREGAPAPRHAPALLGDLLPGSISEILDWALVCGGPRRLPGLADQVSFVLLSPYLGAEQAVKTIVASSEAERLRRQQG